MLRTPAFILHLPRGDSSFSCKKLPVPPISPCTSEQVSRFSLQHHPDTNDNVHEEKSSDDMSNSVNIPNSDNLSNTNDHAHIIDLKTSQSQKGSKTDGKVVHIEILRTDQDENASYVSAEDPIPISLSEQQQSMINLFLQNAETETKIENVVLENNEVQLKEVLKQYSVTQLKQQCREKGLSCVGTKLQLYQRMVGSARAKN